MKFVKFDGFLIKICPILHFLQSLLHLNWDIYLTFDFSFYAVFLNILLHLSNQKYQTQCSILLITTML